MPRQKAAPKRQTCTVVGFEEGDDGLLLAPHPPGPLPPPLSLPPFRPPAFASASGTPLRTVGRAAAAPSPCGFSLLTELPSDALQRVCQLGLSARDMCALEATSAKLAERHLPREERAIEVSAARVLSESTTWWPAAPWRSAGANMTTTAPTTTVPTTMTTDQPTRSAHDENTHQRLIQRSAKEDLHFASAVAEARRCSIALGESSSLLLSRRLTGEPPTHVMETAMRSVCGDWIESSYNSRVRLWRVGSATDTVCGVFNPVDSKLFTSYRGRIRGKLRIVEGRQSEGEPPAELEFYGQWEEGSCDEQMLERLAESGDVENLGRGGFALRLEDKGELLRGDSSSETGWSGAWSMRRCAVQLPAPALDELEVI